MKPHRIALGSLVLSIVASPALGEGDSVKGARAFGACAACHSMEPGGHLTGPSLAGVWGRQAASAQGFARFSPALKRAQIVWNESSLDAWLANLQKVAPGNHMLFGGIADADIRANLVAYLRAASEDKAPPTRRAPALPELKQAPTAAVITRVRASGPARGRPALVGQDMQGDRAQFVSARFEEISVFIREECAG